MEDRYVTIDGKPYVVHPDTGLCVETQLTPEDTEKLVLAKKRMSHDRRVDKSTYKNRMKRRRQKGQA